MFSSLLIAKILQLLGVAPPDPPALPDPPPLKFYLILQPYNNSQTVPYLAPCRSGLVSPLDAGVHTMQLSLHAVAYI